MTQDNSIYFTWYSHYRRIPGLLSLEAIETRLLDTMGPLAALHAACHGAIEGDQDLDPKTVLEAVSNSISFIGNTNSQIIYERRRSILRKLHPELASCVTRASQSADSSDLFGDDLRKSIKESVDLGKEIGGFVKMTNDSE